MNKIIQIISSLLPTGPMDAVGVGVIDFKNKQYQAVEANTFEEKVKFKREPTLYFDLASLTKPLTNSLTYFLKPEIFDYEMLLCLNHRGGLPAWGLLPHSGWKDIIENYKIRESETLYSDFSALRVLVELSNKKINQKSLCQEVWDNETKFWTDLPSWFPTPQCGFKNGHPNYGRVHDPNAFTIGEFVSHAGLFSTTDGLCRTLLNFETRTGFIAKTEKELESHQHRFAHGWDRVIDPMKTLAGRGCGHHTFGHLGFTGTSIWIDPEKQLGHVILTNATKYHWYDKTNLNDLRQAIGEVVWTSTQF